MLASVFGNKNLEKILYFFLMNERCYGRQLSLVFEQSITPFQKTLERLENRGIIISFLEGKIPILSIQSSQPFFKRTERLFSQSL